MHHRHVVCKCLVYICVYDIGFKYNILRGGSTVKNSSNNQTTTVMPTILPLRARQTVKEVERIIEDHHDDAGVDDA